MSPLVQIETTALNIDVFELQVLSADIRSCSNTTLLSVAPPCFAMQFNERLVLQTQCLSSCYSHIFLTALNRMVEAR
jgi:hypothetical protein